MLVVTPNWTVCTEGKHSQNNNCSGLLLTGWQITEWPFFCIQTEAAAIAFVEEHYFKLQNLTNSVQTHSPQPKLSKLYFQKSMTTPL